jgi:pimeloyl-ACP methyl ester carboxylesterase
MNSMNWVRGFNASVGLLAPQTLASKLRREFMTPHTAPPRDWELPLLAQAERITLRFGLSALRWGSGPAVLLMHGWEGRPTQFAELIKALVNAGYGVVALDAPAHGHSPGHEANVVLFARALLEAASELPPLKALVGHSMGGASALLATQLGLRTEVLVSIAAPSRILSMLRRFSHFMGLPRYQLDFPGLIVHAADDPMVPFSEAEALHQNWLDSRLLRLERGGHQRVLADPQMLQAVLQLLESVSQAPSRVLAS